MFSFPMWNSFHIFNTFSLKQQYLTNLFHEDIINPFFGDKSHKRHVNECLEKLMNHMLELSEVKITTNDECVFTQPIYAVLAEYMNNSELLSLLYEFVYNKQLDMHSKYSSLHSHICNLKACDGNTSVRMIKKSMQNMLLDK